MQSIHTPPARCRVVIVRTENISPIDQRQRHGIIRQRQTTMGQRQEQWHAGATAGGGGRTGTRMQRSKVNDARERRREGTQKGGIDGEWADGRSEQADGRSDGKRGGRTGAAAGTWRRRREGNSRSRAGAIYPIKICHRAAARASLLVAHLLTFFYTPSCQSIPRTLQEEKPAVCF